MHKKFLAILALIATVFAFGVGSAMAAKPDDAGPKDPNPACQKEDPPAGCDDGHPGDEDDDDEEEPGTDGNPLAPLCDALGAIDPAVTDVCLQITNALFSGEAPAPPGGGGGEPGGEPSCADIPDPALADGCQDLVDALSGGGGEPGGEPSCADLPDPALAGGCQDLVDALSGDGDPQGLCDAIRDAGLTPVADVCDAVVAILAGDGGGEPGGEPSCADLPDPALAAGCQDLVDALSGGGGEPGGQPSCADLSAVDQALADGCQDLLDTIGVPALR